MNLHSTTVIREMRGSYAVEVSEVIVSAGAVAALCYALQLFDFDKGFKVLCKYLHQPNPLKGFDLDGLAIAVVVVVVACIAAWITLASPHGKGSKYYPQLRKPLKAVLYTATGLIAAYAAVEIAAYHLPLIIGSAKHTGGDVMPTVLLGSLIVAVAVGAAVPVGLLRPNALKKRDETVSTALFASRHPLAYWVIFTLCVIACVYMFELVGIAFCLGTEQGMFDALLKAIGLAMTAGFAAIMLIILGPVLLIALGICRSVMR